MGREVKYIMVADDFGNENPIIFGPAFEHKEVANKLFGKTGTRANVISAGFVFIEDVEEDEEYESGILVKHKLNAYGESISLNLKSRKEDSDALNRLFYGRK